MSTTTAPDDVLSLPEPDVTTTTSRKTLYQTGQINQVEIQVPVAIDGDRSEVRNVTSYVAFDAARLIRIRARQQHSNSNRPMLVVQSEIVLDGFKCGVFDDQGQRVPHPLLSDPRYAAYRQLPHRINGQQWMTPDNVQRLVDLANHLHATGQFSIHTNLRKAENRDTNDKLLVQTTDDFNSLRNAGKANSYGYPIDGFEVSVNLDYPQGFRSFYQGLEEQRNRWEDVASNEDEEERKAQLSELRRNVHYVGGALIPKNAQRWFARGVDVGRLIIDNTDFALYPVRGEQIEASDLLDGLNLDADKGATAPAAPRLTAEDLNFG